MTGYFYWLGQLFLIFSQNIVFRLDLINIIIFIIWANLKFQVENVQLSWKYKSFTVEWDDFGDTFVEILLYCCVYEYSCNIIGLESIWITKANSFSVSVTIAKLGSISIVPHYWQLLVQYERIYIRFSVAFLGSLFDYLAVLLCCLVCRVALVFRRWWIGQDSHFSLSYYPHIPPYRLVSLFLYIFLSFHLSPIHSKSSRVWTMNGVLGSVSLPVQNVSTFPMFLGKRWIGKLTAMK